MSHSDRADAVKDFQSNGKNSPSVMLLSLKVSSLSLSLRSPSLISLSPGRWRGSEPHCCQPPPPAGPRLEPGQRVVSSLLSPHTSLFTDFSLPRQCFDRIHRLGQTKPVFIYKYITKDSIEEKMVEIQNKKKDLITGAFHMPEEERRRERINDIRNIFGI